MPTFPKQRTRPRYLGARYRIGEAKIAGAKAERILKEFEGPRSRYWMGDMDHTSPTAARTPTCPRIRAEDLSLEQCHRIARPPAERKGGKKAGGCSTAKAAKKSAAKKKA
jgi:hypothetical protein